MASVHHCLLKISTLYMFIMVTWQIHPVPFVCFLLSAEKFQGKEK